VSPNNLQAQHVVTAVIVAHDGAAWIPRATEALVNQTRPVQRVVGVDTGSRDRSGAMLTGALGRAAVFGMDRDTGYGAAVHQALRHRAAVTHVPSAAGAPGEQTEWVWLLHDDCEPEPDALERLLLGAQEVPAAAVLGPKVMDWSDRDVLLEAGIGTDRAGRRITGIEPREVDQGQHDGDRDVLAVGSAGMLVRRDVWDQVGGFDPGMLLYREDIDFCWRVRAAGYRVRVITDAVVYHAEASARNRRQASAAPRRGRQDRRNALLVLLGNLPGGPLLSAFAGNMVLSMLRTLFFLVAKRAGAALDEFAAFLGVAGHPLRLLAARRVRSRGRRAAWARLRAEVPPGHSFRKLAEFAVGALSKSRPADMVGSHHATGDPFDDDSLLVDTGLVQRVLTNPGVLLFLVLTTIALVAERSLLSSSPLGGGALVPAWGGASGLWAEYLQGFHPAGIGTSASTPPYVAVVALLASLLGGKAWLAVDVILIGCVPLAGVTAYLASRQITRSVPVRIWAAMAYALLPVGMGAVAAGRLGTALVLVLLPLIAVVAARVFTHGRRRARRAAWAAGLLVAVAAAFVPLVWVVAVAAMALGVLAFRRGRPGVVVDAAIVAVVPVVLLLPWSMSLATHPSELFLEAGLQPAGLAARGLPARSLLLLSPGGPGLPPFWVTAGLVLAAVVALVFGRRRGLVLAGWSAALLGLVAAVALTKLIVTPAIGGGTMRAWPGPALAFAGAGLLLAVLATGDGLHGKLRSGRWRSPSGIAVIALAAVACTAPALAAAAWLTSGIRGPLAPVAGPVLPEFVSVSSDNGLRLRTLVLRAGPHGTVAYSVLRDADPLIGTDELAMPPAAERALNLTVAALTAPHGAAVQDQGRSLAQFGIGYVLLPAPADPALARLLDGVPGLRPVSQTAAFQLWRVSGTAARVRVVGNGGTVVAVRSGTVGVAGGKAPAAGGTLELAEPAGGWTASLNGHPLTPLATPVDGWAQGFRLPPGGGSLTVSHSQLGRVAIVVLEALAVAIVLALGLPGARTAGETEEGAAAAAAARRSAGRTRDEAGDGAPERGSVGRGRGKPASPPRPRVRRPPVPAARDARRVRGAVMAGVRAGPRGWRGGPAPAESFPGDQEAGDPTMVGQARGGAEVPGQGALRPSTGSPGLPGDSAGFPPLDDPGTNPDWPRPDSTRPPDRAGQPGYRAGAGGRSARPGSDRGRPRYAIGPGRGRRGRQPEPDPAQAGYGPAPGRGGPPGHATDPGRAGRPGYDTGTGRGGRGYDTQPGRGGRGYDTQPGRGGQRGYDTDPGRDGRAGYDTGPAHGGGPGYDTGPRRAGRGYDTGSGRGGRPGYATDPGRAERPGYDTGADRGQRPADDADPGRDGRPGSGTGRGRPGYAVGLGRGRRGRQPGPDGGRASYGPAPGPTSRGYDTGPSRPGQPGYDTDPGRAGQRGYDAGRGRAGRPTYAAEPGRGRRGREPGPDRGRAGYGPAQGSDERPGYGPAPGPPAEHGGRRGRIGWPGRGGRSGSDRGPARGERPGPEVQRGRLPGDDVALSPLPPLPSRRPSPGDGYATDDGGGPDWDAEPQHDPGETDW
jgi:GT2 family glycosyltransferase